MRVYIVTSRKDDQDKIVFFLNDNAEKLPKTPRGYRKPYRGMKVRDCMRTRAITAEQLARVERAYTQVIDLRVKS